MTNEATTLPMVVFDERMMLPGPTLVLIAVMFGALCIIVFGLARIRQHRKTPGAPLPRRLMLATGILVLVFAVLDALISIANAFEIRGTISDPAVATGLLDIAVAQQLRFMCIPVLVSGIAFVLAAWMSDGARKESSTGNKTVP